MSVMEPRRLGRPRQVDRPAIVAATLRPPTPSSSRWSCRELSAQLDVSEATVARVWREYGIAPRLHGEYAFTVQPELSAARVRVVGVCVTRRVRAIALLVDDTRLGSDGPHRAAEDSAEGSTGHHDGAHDPQHNGQHDGRPRTTETATKIGVRDFLRRVRESYPDRAVHVVVDSANLQRLLIQSVPQLTTAGVAVHFALDTEKWLNLVDVWYGLMERDGGADETHPAARVRELLDHGRTIVWVESTRDSMAESGLDSAGYSFVGQRITGDNRA